MSGEQYARGGIVEGNVPAEVLVRHTGGGTREYWEPTIGRWVRILTPDEVKAYGTKALEALANKETP